MIELPLSKALEGKNMSSDELSKSQLALEELKLLQGIAEKQEELRFKIRGWCLALVTALTAAFLSEKTDFSGAQYILISCLILALFLWLDVLYRVAQDRALTRAEIVEKNLRGVEEYAGPLIRNSLSVKNTIKDQRTSLNNIRVYGPYLLLFIIVLPVGIFNGGCPF